MNGEPQWFAPPWHKRLTSFGNLNLTEINEIMNDKSWTKAILFRDPSRRLLASYLYLIDKPNQIQFYRKNLLKYRNETTWNDFLSAVTENNFQNLHWKPQVSLPLVHLTQPSLDSTHLPRLVDGLLSFQCFSSSL
jgi:hypothetical protein